MNHILLLDITIRAGNDIDLGRHELWLPRRPAILPQPLGIYPFEVPAWRITVRRILKITLTLMLKGSVTLYAPSAGTPP